MEIIVRKAKKKAPFVFYAIMGGGFLCFDILVLPFVWINSFLAGALTLLFFVPSTLLPWYLFLSWRAQPDILAKSDGSFLYIYGKKETMVPISKLANAQIFVLSPRMLFHYHIFIFTSDKQTIKIKFVDDPVAVRNRLERFTDQNKFRYK